MDFFIKMAVGFVLGFAITFVLLKFLPGEGVILGHDRGRKFAQGSEVNIGKPTGLGFYFTLVFLVVSAVLCFFFNPVTSRIIGIGNLCVSVRLMFYKITINIFVTFA